MRCRKNLAQSDTDGRRNEPPGVVMWRAGHKPGAKQNSDKTPPKRGAR
nr:MAG TPA: hypothetical protein [Caudoviricetes sp.]